jgi:hypothetical protein
MEIKNLLGTMYGVVEGAKRRQLHQKQRVNATERKMAAS